MLLSLEELLDEKLSNVCTVVVPDCGTSHTHTANTGC